jgi:preprotein translocase subunit YajC
MVSVLIGFLQFTQGTKTPWYMVPLIYTLLTYVPMKILQGKQITSHLQMGTEMHKGDRVFVISFVAGVATIVGLLFTSVMVQAVMSSSISS